LVVAVDVMLSSMTESDPKADLRRYLQVGREALLWKLDGLSDYDVRRPMVPTGTNLLGLVKHVAGVEAGISNGCGDAGSHALYGPWRCGDIRA
jgi:hypothetical protein